MTGILGLIAPADSASFFNRMIEVQNHQNFQAEKYQKEGIHLARLHLGYVNSWPQPIMSADKRYAIIMIGENFSYKNIEAGQIENDAQFFLDRWIEDGCDCLPRMNGQYAVAIYDFVENKLILISDRFGTRPVYYTQYNGNFLFAPEPKALVIGGMTKELDYAAVADLFHYGHLFGYKTMFRNVYQMPEASCLTYCEKKIEIRRYWDYPYLEEVYRRRDFTAKQIDDYCKELKVRMLTAIQRQVTKNSQDILISLSGGLDSRYVAALAHRLHVSPLVAFTMGEPDSEDVIYAKIVARELDIQHQCFRIQPIDIWQDARFFARLSDGMSMINGPIQGFTPLRHYSGRRKITLSSQMCDAVMGSTLYRKRIKAIMNKAVPDDESRAVVQNIFNIFDEKQIEGIFLKTVYDQIKGLHLTIPLEYVQCEMHPLHTYFRLLMNEHGRRGTLGGNLMNNLFFETRMPSYDYDLMDFAFRLPIELRKNQFVYRRAFAQMFPELAKIPRQGYNLPISASNVRFQIKAMENRIVNRLKLTSLGSLIKRTRRWNRPSYINYQKWFCDELQTEIRQLLFDRVTTSHAMFNMTVLRDLVNEHLTLKRDNSGLLWQVINLEYFLRDNFD